MKLIERHSIIIKRIFIYFSITIFSIKLLLEKNYENEDYKDLLKFFLGKLNLHKFLNENNIYGYFIKFLYILIDSKIKEIIITLSLLSILAILGYKLASIFTYLLYFILAFSNYLITKEIFKFNFYNLTQEFLLYLVPLFIIPIFEIKIYLQNSEIYNIINESDVNNNEIKQNKIK